MPLWQQGHMETNVHFCKLALAMSWCMQRHCTLSWNGFIFLSNNQKTNEQNDKQAWRQGLHWSPNKHGTPTEQMKGDLFHWVKVQSAEQFKQFFGSTLVTLHPLGARVIGCEVILLIN